MRGAHAREEYADMWRTFFIALGIFLVLIGLEGLAVDQFVFADHAGGQTVTPPDWVPWSLMSAGAVIILYTFTLPRRVKE